MFTMVPSGFIIYEAMKLYEPLSRNKDDGNCL